jgi:hypothetical protein
MGVHFKLLATLGIKTDTTSGRPTSGRPTLPGSPVRWESHGFALLVYGEGRPQGRGGVLRASEACFTLIGLTSLRYAKILKCTLV